MWFQSSALPLPSLLSISNLPVRHFNGYVNVYKSQNCIVARASVFKMFGGGGAKEREVEQEDEAAKDKPSRSAKATEKQEVEEDKTRFLTVEAVQSPSELVQACVTMSPSGTPSFFWGLGRLESGEREQTAKGEMHNSA